MKLQIFICFNVNILSIKGKFFDTVLLINLIFTYNLPIMNEE